MPTLKLVCYAPQSGHQHNRRSGSSPRSAPSISRTSRARRQQPWPSPNTPFGMMSASAPSMPILNGWRGGHNPDPSKTEHGSHLPTRPAPAGLFLPDTGDDLDRPSAPGDWFACRASSGAQCRRAAGTALNVPLWREQGRLASGRLKNLGRIPRLRHAKGANC